MRLASLVVPILIAGASCSAYADAPCDGVYRMEGPFCQGAAFVREKTIEWNSFYRCKATAYDVIDSQLEGKGRHVAYSRRVKVDKACPFKVIQVFEGAHPGSWAVAGYGSVEAYEKRNDIDWVLAGGNKENRAASMCGVVWPDPTPDKACNLPFARGHR